MLLGYSAALRMAEPLSDIHAAAPISAAPPAYNPGFREATPPMTHPGFVDTQAGGASAGWADAVGASTASLLSEPAERAAPLPGAAPEFRTLEDVVDAPAPSLAFDSPAYGGRVAWAEAPLPVLSAPDIAAPETLARDADLFAAVERAAETSGALNRLTTGEVDAPPDAPQPEAAVFPFEAPLEAFALPVPGAPMVPTDPPPDLWG